MCHWSEPSVLYGGAPSWGKLEGWLSGAGAAVWTLMLSPLTVVVAEAEKGAELEEEVVGLVSALLPGLWKCT